MWWWWLCFNYCSWARDTPFQIGSLPLPTHLSFTGVVVPGAELEAARCEDLLDIVLDVSDEAGRQLRLLVKQLSQQGYQHQAQGLAERLVWEDAYCLRDKDVVRKVVQVIQQGLVQELEDHLEDVSDGGLLEAHTAILCFEVGFREWSLKKNASTKSSTDRCKKKTCS